MNSNVYDGKCFADLYFHFLIMPFDKKITNNIISGSVKPKRVVQTKESKNSYTVAIFSLNSRQKVTGIEHSNHILSTHQLAHRGCIRFYLIIRRVQIGPTEALYCQEQRIQLSSAHCWMCWVAHILFNGRLQYYASSVLSRIHTIANLLFTCAWTKSK